MVLRRTIIGTLLWSFVTGAWAQSTCRYWFDNDETTQQTTNSSGEVTLDLDIGHLTKDMVHALHVQVCNSEGVWSSPLTNYFYLPASEQVSTTARYWFDNDETTQQTTTTVNGIIDVDIQKLSAGLHAIHYQTFSQEGMPSSTMTERFIVQDLGNERLTCQLWFDDDEETAVVKAVTKDGIILDVSEMSTGMHILNVALFDEYGCLVSIETAEFEVTANMETITLPSLGCGTYSSTNDLDFSGLKAIKAYIASGYDVEKEVILLTRVYKVPAGTGLIVMGKAESYDVPQSKIKYVYANMLKGIVAPQTVTQASEGFTHFLLKEGEQGAAFYQLEADAEVPAGSVYLAIPTSVLPKSGIVKMEISGGLKGDVDEDGVVDIADAVRIVNYVVGKINALAPRYEGMLPEPE